MYKPVQVCQQLGQDSRRVPAAHSAQCAKPQGRGGPPSPEGCCAGQHRQMLCGTAQTKTRGQQLQRRALRQRQHCTQGTSEHGRLLGEGQEAPTPKPTGARRAPFCCEVPISGNERYLGVPQAAKTGTGTKAGREDTMDACAPRPSKLPRTSAAPAGEGTWSQTRVSLPSPHR